MSYPLQFLFDMIHILHTTHDWMNMATFFFHDFWKKSWLASQCSYVPASSMGALVILMNTKPYCPLKEPCCLHIKTVCVYVQQKKQWWWCLHEDITWQFVTLPCRQSWLTTGPWITANNKYDSKRVHHAVNRGCVCSGTWLATWQFMSPLLVDSCQNASRLIGKWIKYTVQYIIKRGIVRKRQHKQCTWRGKN